MAVYHPSTLVFHFVKSTSVKMVGRYLQNRVFCIPEEGNLNFPVSLTEIPYDIHVHSLFFFSVVDIQELNDLDIILADMTKDPKW